MKTPSATTTTANAFAEDMRLDGSEAGLLYFEEDISLSVRVDSINDII